MGKPQENGGLPSDNGGLMINGLKKQRKMVISRWDIPGLVMTLTVCIG